MCLYTQKSELQKIKTTQNSSNYDVNLTGKIDIRTTETINLTFGGSYYTLNSNNYDYGNSMFNYDKNTHVGQKYLEGVRSLHTALPYR